MQYLDLTLETAAQNLACDEALLDLCEEGYDREILRFWESPSYFVVVGYSNKIHREVDINSCTQAAIPIFRRVSGGGAVLQGPGCLNFSLLLDLDSKRPIKNLVQANRYVLEQHKKALDPLLAAPSTVCGTSDLALGDLKFSGNAQRRRRRFMLFHGTFLLNFDLDLVGKILCMPSREPDYRKGRSHADFLMNLALKKSCVQKAVQAHWQAEDPFPRKRLPQNAIDHLVETRYTREDWNFKFA